MKRTIIAEVGQNFCGSIELAEYMIWAANDAGADLVKFQLFDSQKLYGKKIEAELSFEQALHLFNFGKRLGIMGVEVFFSVFDTERVKWCEQIGVKRYKLACGLVHPKTHQNTDILWAIIETKKPLIISYSAVPKGVPIPLEDVSSLYCVPHYPTGIGELHFNDVDFSKYDGFSDHTEGIEAAQIALVKGAKIIEKHFCVNHQLGVDAGWSMDCDELRKLALFADNLEECL
jgi:N,N'-diacetyllegionaminate synthase